MMDWQDVIGYAFEFMPYGMAVVLAFVLVALLMGLYRSPLVAVAAVLCVTIWEVAAPALPVLRLGLSLSPFDFVFASIGFVALLRLVFLPRGSYSLGWPLSILVVVLLGSFVVGLARFGVKAGVEFRNDFYFWGLCVYLVTFRPTDAWLNRTLDLWLAAAFVLCLIVWYRWLADAFGLDWIYPFWRYADATGVAFNRVAASSAALVMGLAVLISVNSLALRRAEALHYLFLPALLLTIVFLQHRSVWVATLLPLLLLLVQRMRGSERSVGPIVAALGSLVIVGAVLSSGVFGGATQSVADQARRATDTTGGTFVGRVDGWQELLRRWSGLGPVGLAVGEPYGSGFERHIGSNWGGSTVEYAPHNYFVALLLRGGAAGLLVFLLVLWRLGAAGLAPPVKEGEGSQFGPPLVLALTLCVVLYCIPYSPTPASAVLIGAALSIALRPRKRHRDHPEVDALGPKGVTSGDAARVPTGLPAATALDRPGLR